MGDSFETPRPTNFFTVFFNGDVGTRKFRVPVGATLAELRAMFAAEMTDASADVLPALYIRDRASNIEYELVRLPAFPHTQTRTNIHLLSIETI